MKAVIVIVVMSLATTAILIPFCKSGIEWEESVNDRFNTGHLGSPSSHRPLTFWITNLFKATGLNLLNSLLFTRILVYLSLFFSLNLYYKDYLKLLIVPCVLVVPLLSSNMSTPFTINSILDCALFALGLIAIDNKKEWWLYPIMVVGALNRETILLLPLLGLGARRSKVILPFFLGLIIYVILRIKLPGEFVMATYPGYSPGWETVKINLQLNNLIFLFATISALPLLVDYKNMEHKIRNGIISLYYIAGMFWFGCVSEPRLILPVILLVLIPNLKGK